KAANKEMIAARDQAGICTGNTSKTTDAHKPTKLFDRRFIVATKHGLSRGRQITRCVRYFLEFPCAAILAKDRINTLLDFLGPGFLALINQFRGEPCGLEHSRQL